MIPVRIGDHHAVASALHLFHREAATRREHRIDRAVRSVLQDHGRGDHAAVGEDLEGLDLQEGAKVSVYRADRPDKRVTLSLKVNKKLKRRVIVLSEPFAREMERLFALDVDASYEITSDSWRSRGLASRVTEWLARRWEYFL